MDAHGIGGSLVLADDEVYKYDAWGNRVEQDVTDSSGSSKAEYALDGWNPAKAGATGQSGWDTWSQLDGNNNNLLEIRYLNGDAVDQLFARIAGTGGSAYWMLTDRMGSVRDVIDSSGDGAGPHQLRRLGQHPQPDELDVPRCLRVGRLPVRQPRRACTRRRPGSMTRRRAGGLVRIRWGLMRVTPTCIDMSKTSRRTNSIRVA